MALFRKRLQVDLNDPDFENSEAAIRETAILFLAMIKSTPSEWVRQGNRTLDDWLAFKKAWLPDLEFEISQEMHKKIWAIFSGSVMNQKSPGRYGPDVMEKIVEEVEEYLITLPSKFHGTKIERLEFGGSLTHGMWLVLENDKQYLAQTFIVRLCAVWLHAHR